MGISDNVQIMTKEEFEKTKEQEYLRGCLVAKDIITSLLSEEGYSKEQIAETNNEVFLGACRQCGSRVALIGIKTG